MNRLAVFIYILIGLGIFLWFQREELGLTQTEGSTSFRSEPRPPTPSGEAYFIIRHKVKPGGYIGWHQTERNNLTGSPVQTRQSSNFYFVCTEVGSSAERIFLVSESVFNMERAGNILPWSQVRTFTEVTSMEEPELPPSFEFRRRDR